VVHGSRLLVSVLMWVALGAGGAVRAAGSQPDNPEQPARPPITAAPTVAEFANLARYAVANLRLPAAGRERRVVFLGDSITENWGQLEPDYFSRPDRINRGISGQTTPQMLLRFRQDVIALKPVVVHILAGTNDIAGNVGPMDLEVTEANIASMVDLACANGIRVVVGSVLPVADYPWHRGLNPGPKIVALDDWLKGYARARHLVYVDYYSAMTDGALGVPPALAPDGVHPNAEGYRVMRPLAEAGIRASFRNPGPRTGTAACPIF
jgi:lysophospholipase L1-like esterase